MNFINPKTDFAFKRIFGSEQSKPILISFLNALLYQGKSTIADLEILNPYLAPKVRGMKDSFLDIKAKLADQTSVIIEMQVLNYEGFEKRILFNAAKSYSTQLKIGEGYSLLNPVIALTITDFTMFESLEMVVSRFVLKEKEYLLDYPIDDLELVFVELPKFDKALDELTSLTDQWLNFLKHARDLERVPETMGSIPAIQQAFDIADQANLTPEELDDLQQREFYLYDMQTALDRTAAKVARETAARVERATAKAKTLEIARQLLDVLDAATISQKTGLSLEEVRGLQQEG